MKRIVYTVRSLSNSGGIERCLINKANWLIDKGYDITIITEDSIECFYQVNPRINILTLNVRKRLSEHLLVRIYRFIVFSMTYGFNLSRILRNINPDVVISVNARDFVILPFVNRKSKKIYEFHWIVSRTSDNQNLLSKTVSKIMDIVGNCYDSVILLTQKDKESSSNRWKNVRVIPNSCTLTCDTPAKLSSNRAIAVGNLFHIKGFSRLIDIWGIVHQQYPNWSLSIYGDGYLKDELQSKIDACSLTSVVKLEGKIVDIKSAYLQSLFSLVSSYEESFSLTLLEAQTCGLPVIAFDCPFGPSEIIRNGCDGFLIPNNDIQQFADKVCKLIGDENLRKEMGYNAINNSKRFTEDKVMQLWVQLFDE